MAHQENADSTQPYEPGIEYIAAVQNSCFVSACVNVEQRNTIALVVASARDRKKLHGRGYKRGWNVIYYFIILMNIINLR